MKTDVIAATSAAPALVRTIGRGAWARVTIGRGTWARVTIVRGTWARVTIGRGTWCHYWPWDVRETRRPIRAALGDRVV